MGTYRDLKQRARQSLKTHYWLYVAACLIAAFIGSEFVLTLHVVKLNISLPENAMLGRSEGVFAKIVNEITMGTTVGAIKSGIRQIVGEKSIVDGFFVFLSVMMYAFMWIFVDNVYKVSIRRIFLEGRIYKEVRYQRFIYIIQIKKWAKTAWNMFVLSMLQFLWIFTIIGPFVVRYSYYMVPYILAENPDIGARQAINISKQMMNGYKWKCFLFELSFIGWDLLGVLTLGAASILFSNPYKIASFSEIYAVLRQNAIQKNQEYSQYLKDVYLFEKCDKNKLNETYADIVRLEEMSLDDYDDKEYGIKGKIVAFLGISILGHEKEQEYEAAQIHKIKIDLYKNAIAGNEYPERLSIFPEKEKRQMVEILHYMRHYSIWSIILMFFIFSVTGWVWEVVMHLVVYGTFVNRGMLHGPWLPIYGTGAVMILTLLSFLKNRPIKEFTYAIVLCGVVEYMTSYIAEQIHGVRWWDYEGYFLNINGRICAEGLLVFGLGGIIVVYVVAPLLDNIIRKINLKIIIPICIALIILFVTDIVYTQKVPNVGSGITSGAVVSQEDTTIRINE